MVLSKTLEETRYQKNPKRNSYIPVGKIVGSFGYKGELKIIPYDSWPKENCLDNIYIDFPENLKKYTIKSIRKHNKFFLMMLKNIYTDNIDQLINKELWLERKNAEPLKRGEYYSKDLLGITVYNHNNFEIGTLSDIIKMNPVHDIYVVKNKSNEYLIPALSKFIYEINIPKGKMKVNTAELYE